MLVHTPTQTEVEEYTANMCGPLEPLPVAVVMGGPGAYAEWIAGIVMCSKCGTGHTRVTGPQKVI